MKSFSERKGLKPVSEVIQTKGMNAELRTGLWNVLHTAIWSTDQFLHSSHSYPGIDSFSERLWIHYFKKPVDTRPYDSETKLALIREYFFKCTWNEVYDFLEYVVADQQRERPTLSEFLNFMLEREMSGYRIINGHVVDITSEQEVEMLEAAIKDTRFTGVSKHLARALELLANREHPDYRNSIKEAISAVESIARIVAGDSKATLPDALKALERRAKLHTALKDGFVKIYGYTSDESGIRHAMLDEPNLTAADAKFFLLSCTSFVNYLKARLTGDGT